MSTDSPSFLSGLLLERPQEVIDRDDLASATRFHFKRLIAGSHWEEFEFTSHTALKGEDMYVQGPYRYRLACRRSGSRLLLLASARSIAEHILDEVFRYTFVPNLRRIPISVDELVKALVQRPTIYALNFVHARVPAFGTSLRSISFYGDDLADASFFRDHVVLMNFFACGIRHAVGGPEVVRLTADGGISFFAAGETRYGEVEQVLRFLRQEGYLQSDIWEKDA
jgi:hypothetical protein